MSDPRPVPAKEAAPRSGGSSLRLIVLLGILLIAGVAAAWDYLVARPAHATAIKQVQALMPPENKGGDPVQQAEQGEQVKDWKPSSQKEVHDLLGDSPAETETAGAYLVERYSWRRGLPWLTYDLFVIYDDDNLRMLRNATTERTEVDMYRTSTPLSELDKVEPETADQASPETAEEGEPADAPADDAPEASGAGAAETPAPESSATESPANGS